MIQQIKAQFSAVSAMFDVAFTTKNFGEYEDFAQNYDFETASVNLIPLKSYDSGIDVSGAVRYRGSFEVYFLKKFVKSDNFEDKKDEIIDEMISLSEAWYKELDRNQFLLFNLPQWSWRADIIRQFTANMLCGVKVTVSLDTLCNRFEGNEPIPTLPIVIRNSDGSYVINGQSKDSPFILPDVEVVINGTSLFYPYGTIILNPTVPAFSLEPEAANITATSFDIVTQSNVIGNVYALILPNGSPVPSVATIKEHGQVQAEAGAGVLFEFTGLTELPDYDVYVVASDKWNNNTEVVKVDVQTLSGILQVNVLYDYHSARVIADGGVIESEAKTKAAMQVLIDNYQPTSIAEFNERVPVTLSPELFGYKIGTGTGRSAIWGCEKLYSINPLADVSQPLTNKPVLLAYEGENYFYAPRVAKTAARTINSQVVSYTSATDTLVFTAKILLGNQTASALDFIFTCGSAGNFQIRNFGANKQLRVRTTANALDSAQYTPSITQPHWVRISITPTNVIYEWSADGVIFTNIGTVAAPTPGTLSNIMQYGNTNASLENAIKIYYGEFENITNGQKCTFNPQLFDRIVSETGWEDIDCTWGIQTPVPETSTGIKSLVVDQSMIIGDGLIHSLISDVINITQPHTAYLTAKRQGEGVYYSLASNSQLFYSAGNTFLNNGTLMQKANSSTNSQLITAFSDGMNSFLEVDNTGLVSGDSGNNGGDKVEILGNGATKGNHVFQSLIIVSNA